MKFSDLFKSNKPTNTTNMEEKETMKEEMKNVKERVLEQGKEHVYNLIIIDESGSMECLKPATISGVNETINTIRQAQKEFGDKQQHFITLVTFDTRGKDDDVRTLIDCEPIAEVKDFTEYNPNGCTPLLDAIGMSVTRLHNAIREDADASALVTIITDGLENASREFSGPQIKELIEKLKAEGWTFSYMGSDHDVEMVTRSLSIDNVMEFGHDDASTRTSWNRESSAKMAHFRKLDDEWEEMRDYSFEQKMSRKARMSREYYSGRITPDHVDTLSENQVIVLGRDPKLRGLNGNVYSIPTMGGFELMKEAIVEFVKFAEQNPDKQFFVTRVGCGRAGYSSSEVAPLLAECARLENVALPIEFWKSLGISILNSL